MAYQATNPTTRSGTTLRLRLTPERRDFWAFTLWVLVTFIQFPGDELILYPLALYFTYSIWRDQTKVVPLLARGWVPLMFCAWCLISPIWAVEPVTALKLTLYLILTMMICYHAAAVLTARQVMRAVVFATGIVGILSLIWGLAGLAPMNTGVFEQKNTMGKSMVMLWIAAFAMSLDGGTGPRGRMLAGILAAVAFFLGVASESATAVLLMMGTGGIILLGQIVLKGGINRPSRLALSFVLLAIMFFAMSFILPTLQASPVEMILERFGKDSTLTGRTGLWNHAAEQIAKEPWLGVGHGGFWRYNSSPLVQMIFEDYHKDPWQTFNFHNTYYEIAVHQGYIGLALVVIAIIWTQGLIMRGVLRFATMPYIFFLAQSIAVIARTFTESDFLRHFVLFHMLFWIAALIVLKEEMNSRHAAPARRKRPTQKSRRYL